MSGLIWIQTVCKGYQQVTSAAKDLKSNTNTCIRKNIVNYIQTKINTSKALIKPYRSTTNMITKTDV